MVLKDSKWDRKAKAKYLRKHGLQKPKEQEPVVGPKWSAKKAVARRTPILEDSDDSDDDEFLKQHYPQLGEDLSKEQKEKIKQQILVDLQKEVDGPLSDHELDQLTGVNKEVDGIYLGSESSKQHDLEQKAQESRLDEYLSQEMAGTDVSSIPKKNRKLLRNKMADDLLLEYGLLDYKQTVNNDQDYDRPFRNKQAQRNLDRIADEDLIGFKIGQDSIGDNDHKKSRPRVVNLAAEDVKEDQERLMASEQAKLYRQMQEKFGTATHQAPTLEINNINELDPQQMSVLNNRLTHQEMQHGSNLDDDLLEILGSNSNNNDKTVGYKSSSASGPQNIDSFLSDLSIKDAHTDKHAKQTTPKPTYKPSQNDEDFLDDLLK